jgi:hypothetical protein
VGFVLVSVCTSIITYCNTLTEESQGVAALDCTHVISRPLSGISCRREVRSLNVWRRSDVCSEVNRPSTQYCLSLECGLIAHLLVSHRQSRQDFCLARAYAEATNIQYHYLAVSVIEWRLVRGFLFKVPHIDRCIDQHDPTTLDDECSCCVKGPAARFETPNRRPSWRLGHSEAFSPEQSP